MPDDDEPEGAAADEPPSTLELGCVRRGASGGRDGRAWARFEDGHGAVRFERVRGGAPRGKYDLTVAGISYLTAVDRFELAGQVVLNEARALRRADTASIVRRCTLFDRARGGEP